MSKVNYCISVDWFQCYCIDNQMKDEVQYEKKDEKLDINALIEASKNTSGKPAEITMPTIEAVKSKFDTDGPIRMSFGYIEIKRRDYGTQLWQRVYDVTHKGQGVCVICRMPRSSAIRKNAVSLKLDNRILYSQQWVSILEELLLVFDLQYKGVTRLDLAYDCNVLANGQSVPDFLMQYFSHAPFCSGHIVRVGSRKVEIQATRAMSGATIISGMRWGSPKSDVGAYCYNKTLEMVEVKEKPWIIEAWKRNGVVSSIDKNRWDALGMDGKKRSPEEQAAKTQAAQQKAIEGGQVMDFIHTSVWRFELSIKAHGKDLVNLRTGDLFQISPEYLSSQSKVEELFYTYAAKYFDFRISTGQTQVKNYKPMKIFASSFDITMKPMRVVRYADTGRTEKMIANKLNGLFDKYSDLSALQMSSIRAVLSFLNEIRGMRGIGRYIEAKGEQKEIAKALKQSERKGVDIVKLDAEFGHGYPAFVEFCRLNGLKIDPYSGYNYFRSLADEVAIQSAIDEDNAKRGLLSDITPVW